MKNSDLRSFLSDLKSSIDILPIQRIPMERHPSWDLFDIQQEHKFNVVPFLAIAIFSVSSLNYH